MDIAAEFHIKVIGLDNVGIRVCTEFEVHREEGLKKIASNIFLLQRRDSKDIRPSKIAQWVKALVTNPDNLSLIPGTHNVEKEITPMSYPLTSTRVLWHTCSHTHEIKF